MRVTPAVQVRNRPRSCSTRTVRGKAIRRQTVAVQVVTASVDAASWAVGAQGPVITHELVRSDLVRYAGASGDFFPLHTDDDYARSAGFDGVFAHGMYLAGLLATAVDNWVGIGALRSYQVRFTAKARPGDVLRTRLKVVDATNRGSIIRVEIDCRLVDSAEAVVIQGAAVANIGALPTQHHHSSTKGHTH